MTSPNAELLQRTNKIKQNLSYDILSTDQQSAYDQLKKHAEKGEKTINLYGSAGTGKTVLCWVFAEEEGWQYLPDTGAEPEANSVIFDHGDTDRESTRRLRARMELKSISRSIYVSRSPATELYPRVELDSESDYQENIQNKFK